MKKHIYSDMNPIPNHNSVIQGDKYRFTILTSRLIRAEYSEDGKFVDQQTKLALNRNFPDVNYKIIEKEDSLEIITDHVIVRYNKKEFSSHSLVFKLRGNYSHYKSDWYYGEKIDDLKGTAHTLDYADGEIPLERGLMSRKGFSVLDDSDTIILKSDGWYEKKSTDSIDIYYFGYGHDYLDCLKDYYELTSYPPLLPKYVFGNWWSRHYEYSEESYLELVDCFEKEEIPFTVAVIDMDWHIVDVPEKYGSGWTGYSWNEELFPDPKRFISRLKERGYAVTLNTHPAEGVRPFESAYLPMAKELGVDYKNEEYITFDILDEKFIDAYFKYLHHPNEEMGVDFWWVDWQQSGEGERFKGMKKDDPQWVLNHYHYHDANRNKRSITFSRYSGPGSHRYPVGFSGDTIMSWESLDFQPYFTATASNIGYTWWSHDIGGHMRGYYSAELILRWVQLGVFSPINRLHSAKSDFLGKEPWRYKEPYQSFIKQFLRLRHKLIPYLYTMNYQTHLYGIPLVMPLYYKNSERDEAYEYRNEFYFGSELIVMPITKKINPVTGRASFKGWLPEGNWVDVFTGVKYRGDRILTIYRDLDNIGVFAKEGAIIPLYLDGNNNSIDAWKDTKFIVYCGKDGEFTVIEDDESNKIVKTKVIYNEEKKCLQLKSEYDAGVSFETKRRKCVFKFIGRKLNAVNVYVDGELVCADLTYNLKKCYSEVAINDLTVKSEVVIKWCDSEELLVNKLALIKNYLMHAEIDNKLKETIYSICSNCQSNDILISSLLSLECDEEIVMPIIELLGG